MKSKLVRDSVRNLARDTKGANLVEYIILVGMVAVLCLLAFKSFGDKVYDKVTGQTAAVGTVNSDPKPATGP